MFFHRQTSQAYLEKLPPVTFSPDSADARAVTPITSFYCTPNGSTDDEGRTLDDILQYSDYRLEGRHDYIQHLFPLPERSPYNPHAPQIDAATAAAFRASPALRARLDQSFRRMLAFYGLRTRDSIVEKDPQTFAQHSLGWMSKFDHNHLRMTRIIRCLRVLGCEAQASAFYTALVKIAESAHGYTKPSATSLKFWKRAAKRPLVVPPENEEHPEPETDDEDEHGDEEAEEEEGNEAILEVDGIAQEAKDGLISKVNIEKKKLEEKDKDDSDDDSDDDDYVDSYDSDGGSDSEESEDGWGSVDSDEINDLVADLEKETLDTPKLSTANAAADSLDSKTKNADN